LEQYHGTTILGVKKDGRTVIAGDGQVSLGNTVIKPNAKKVRRLGDGSVIGGFAGATADAFTLFERLEKKLEAHRGQLLRAAVELGKDWRTDKYLRNLEARMIVADKDTLLILNGHGDVLGPEGVLGASSVVVQPRVLRGPAQVLPTEAAGAAPPARPSQPRDAHPVTDRQATCGRTEGDDATHDLVAGDHLRRTRRELEVRQVQVGATHAAGGHADEHLVGRGRRHRPHDLLEAPRCPRPAAHHPGPHRGGGARHVSPPA